MPRDPRILSVVLLVTTFAVVWQTFSARHFWSYAVPLDDPVQVEANILESSRVSPDERVIEDPIAGPTPLYDTPKQVNYARAPPAPHTLTIIAVGDLHGDLLSARTVLRKADVVNSKGEWTGKVDVLIQTGDVIDRGVDTIALFQFLDNLRAQAEAVGGQVISLLGNHEYFNVLPYWADVQKSELATFGTWEDRWNAISTGSIGTNWKNHYKVACRLPLHPSIGPTNADYDGKKTSPLSHAAISFVHGGLSPKFTEMTPFPSRINEIGLATLSKLQSFDWPGMKMTATQKKLFNDRKDLRDKLFSKVARFQMGELSKEELGMLGDNSPLNYRGWADLSDDVVCAQVNDVLEKTGTAFMVMGHTAQLHDKGILERCGGKIFVIDTGISSFYYAHGGVKSALRIVYSLTPKAESAGSGDEQVWVEYSEVTAIYETFQRVLHRSARREVTGNFAV